VLEATVIPLLIRNRHQRSQIAVMANTARDGSQGVRHHLPDFVEYFRRSYTEQELGEPKIGSHPARRRRVEASNTLRCDSWIFAWTQTRLMLPAWFGVGRRSEDALQED
jgi:phosphoenolpyruvate carboxylase